MTKVFFFFNFSFNYDYFNSFKFTIYDEDSPIDLPPILSVDLIQITDKTSIPFAAKAAETLRKNKKKKKKKS